ncbi:MAG: SPASM domain-containing protein, partial [Deltaproteobacteria bacterium]|nr:SPASM domain-containing protein [Deltaproteobacteria bacterium]
NCNFRCIMCPQAIDPRYAKYKGEYNMPLETFERIARELFDDAHFVDLRGFGETVILPYWSDIVDRLEQYPFINWHLVTNLSVHRDQLWDKMIQRGFSLGFSCDAATKETFERIRVGSHFERILHNLEVVTDSIRRHKRGQLYMIVTVQRGNIDELPQIIELAHRYGVRDVQFKMVRKNGDGHAEYPTPAMTERLKAALNRSLELADDFVVKLMVNDQDMLALMDPKKAAQVAAIALETHHNFPPPPGFDPEFVAAHSWRALGDRLSDVSRVSVNKTCFKPFHYTYFAHDGRVGTCNHMMDPDMLVLGDLRKNSFSEIWNSDEYQFFRGTVLHNRLQHKRCLWCFEHRLDD